jgi:glycosyltransferase involved in cell wall biosynthesis
MRPLDSALFLNDHCFVQGGASRIAIDEAVAVADSGVRVVFLGATGPIGPELAHSRVETVCLGQPELASFAARPEVAWQGLWNGMAARRARLILSGLDPARSVVHVHGYTKSLTTSPVRAAVMAGFPVILTLHDFFSMCPNGNLYDYRKEQPCALRPMSLPCVRTNCDKHNYAHKLFRVTRGLLQRWPGLLPDGIGDFIGLSDRSTDLIRPHLPAAARIHMLTNIVDVERAPPVNLSGEGTLVCVGRLDPEKGIRLLLAAAERTGARIVFVGDGPLRGSVEASGRHRVTGWLPASGVQAELARARCLLFPSQWYETFGLVVAEAAARGIPAIVSDVCAAAERVRDGTTGFVFRSGDVADLGRCLEATEDIAALARIGQACYEEHWSAPPTRANHLARLLEIYASALAARQSSAPRLAVATGSRARP